MGDERDRRRAGEHANSARPRAGGVHDPARGELTVRREHARAASRLHPHAAHLDAEALLDAAPAGVAQVAPEERVHVDVAVVGHERGAGEALDEQHGYARDRLGG